VSFTGLGHNKTLKQICGRNTQKDLIMCHSEYKGLSMSLMLDNTSTSSSVKNSVASVVVSVIYANSYQHLP